jgi:hypothetical protein
MAGYARNAKFLEEFRAMAGVSPAGDHAMADAELTVRDLRRRWKPHKQRLQELVPEHPTNIRFHRACSWLQRAGQVEGKDDLDVALIGQWVAFNALYGQWDEATREPLRDCTCWRAFLDRIRDLDADGRIADVLNENKPLVMSIFEDEYLSRFFWEEPGTIRAKKSKKVKFDAQTWYIDGNWTLILDRLIERIYLLRCQMVHGAATYNGALNRTAVRRCSMMLGHLLRAILLVWIDHGADEDWGQMCYPPQRKGVAGGVR